MAVAMCSLLMGVGILCEAPCLAVAGASGSFSQVPYGVFCLPNP